MLKKLRAKKLPGFTLLELVVVIVVIGILAAIAIPTFQGVIDRAHDASAQTTLQAITRDAEAVYAFDQGSTPADWYAAFATAVAETPGASSQITATTNAVIVIDAPDAENLATYQAAVEATGAATPATGASTLGTISVSVNQANNIVGVAYLTSASHCAFATTLFDKTQTATLPAESWNLSANLGTNCKGSKALLGSIATRADQDNLVTTGQSQVGAYNWTNIIQGQQDRYLADVATSADGTKIIVAFVNEYIQISTDSGLTWTERTEPGAQIWMSVTSSSDGTRLTALSNGGSLWTSADSGLTWSASTDSRYWGAMTASSDGLKIVALDGVISGGQLVSSDGGTTWLEEPKVGTSYWQSITSSSDGTKLVAVEYPGGLYTSSDSGLTWTVNTAIGQGNWASVNSSPDGTKIAVTDSDGNIWVSDNSGLTWTQQPNTINTHNIVFSADGEKIYAGSNADGIWTSTNLGTSWIQTIGTVGTNWTGGTWWTVVSINTVQSKIIAYINEPDRSPLYVGTING